MVKFKNANNLSDSNGILFIDLNTIDSNLLLELIQDYTMGVLAQCYSRMVEPETVAELELLTRTYWGVPAHIDLILEYGKKGNRKNTTAATLGYLTVSVGQKPLFTMWQHLPDYDLDGVTNIQLVNYREYTEHARPIKRPNATN